MNEIRVNAVKKSMESLGLDQIVLTEPAAVCYLTGSLYDPGERLLALYLNRTGGDFLLLSALFSLSAAEGIKTLTYQDTEDPVAILAGQVAHSRPLGIDKDMAARFLLRLMELGAASAYKNASVCVDSLRAVKDAEEAGRMRAASRLNDSAMEALRPYIKTGVTEIALSDTLKGIYRELGADGLSFEPLIGFGPNAAVGHHMPDTTALKDGDCVLLDIGCKKDGYCADMTRTYFKGSAPDRLREIYAVVRSAGDAARAAIAPGVPLCDIDAAARTVIEAAGYGPYFTHRLGHFIGMNVHEAGDVSSSNTAPAVPGMVFSVEPGIYLPGEGGVRIEDLVLVTAEGAEVLNSAPRELLIL